MFVCYSEIAVEGAAMAVRWAGAHLAAFSICRANSVVVIPPREDEVRRRSRLRLPFAVRW